LASLAARSQPLGGRRAGTRQKMRVVAGEARGRHFDAPPGRTTRPTSDRVREAIFGVLGSLSLDLSPDLGPAADDDDDRGSTIEDATVADLFAGSGALGIEALSRGAARATFVESDRNAAATIERNLTNLGLGAGQPGRSSVVVQSDVLRWLRTADPVDIAFCDPPYAFSEAEWAELASLLAPVTRLAVLEMGRRRDLGPQWELLKEKHYGGTVVLVARPARLPEPARDRKGDT
jgi:16S rRNA (guanine966-N2)-methyltransferase